MEVRSVAGKNLGQIVDAFAKRVTGCVNLTADGCVSVRADTGAAAFLDGL